jgi:tRNA threonylcarbamoyl adenosine modification protein (Sua5/YciO/YrdC/YwlC family)
MQRVERTGSRANLRIKRHQPSKEQPLHYLQRHERDQRVREGQHPHIQAYEAKSARSLTFILPTTSSLPKIYKNKKTVGIRVPDNNIIREIVTQLGNPVLNTSVKIGDDEIEYSTDPELIHEKWGEIATVVIDGGIGDTEPSTVVDCTSDEPIIIRQGKGVLNL